MKIETMKGLEMTTEREIAILEATTWILRGLALAGIAMIITVLVACSSSPEINAPRILEVHGCGGSTIQWGPAVAQVEFCERSIGEGADLKHCTLVTAAIVNGMPIGTGAIPATSAPECEAAYGWFPAGLGVGTRAEMGRDDSGRGDPRGGADPLADTIGELGTSAGSP